MNLNIDLPEWAAERHIAIMAGMELVAYKPYGSDTLYVKTVRCNNCGWCCDHLAEGFPRDENGVCIYLGPVIGTERLCTLGLSCPWRCVWSDPILTKAPGAKDHCSIRYEIIDLSL